MNVARCLVVACLALAPLTGCGDDEGQTQGGSAPQGGTAPLGGSGSGGSGDGECVDADCPGEQTCKGGVCADPTADQLAQAHTLETYVDTTVAETGWSDPIDGDAVKAAGRLAIVKSDGSDASFFAAMRGAQLEMRQGHQALYLGSGCDTAAMPMQNMSRLGVCGRPYGDDIVVTYAEAGNPLGLVAGDRVVATDGVSGAAMFDAANRRAMCGVVSPSPSGMRTSAAASFFGTVPAGASLSIEPVGGALRTVEVPDEDGDYISCQDALGRDIAFNAQASVRPDGVAVIRLPRFYPIDQTLPQNPTQQDYDAFIAEFQAKIVAEFDTVKDAPAIVWDARGNYGGISVVGIAIANGMASAQATNISYCTSRVEGSDPPAFDDFEYAVYDIAPGGPFTYAGVSVVLVDGLDYSAGDYFPLAVRVGTNTPIVGEASAGAFGGSGALQPLEGPPAMQFATDSNRCVDALTGDPLEGNATLPDIEVSYEPADLARGIDTPLEAAVARALADLD